MNAFRKTNVPVYNVYIDMSSVKTPKRSCKYVGWVYYTRDAHDRNPTFEYFLWVSMCVWFSEINLLQCFQFTILHPSREQINSWISKFIPWQIQFSQVWGVWSQSCIQSYTTFIRDATIIQPVENNDTLYSCILRYTTLISHSFTIKRFNTFSLSFFNCILY